jgi:hypothetical protein
MKLSSRLYDCKIWHRRRLPKPNSFAVSTFMFLIDLDEINAQSPCGKVVGSRLARFYQLKNEDHIDATARDIRAKLLDFIATQSEELASNIAKIKLLTHLRFLNFVFNPISVYYCYDSSEKLLAAVAEVENTFRERKLYLLAGEKEFKQSFSKEFYVSPFSSVDGKFEFALNQPGEELEVFVTFRQNDLVTLEAGMHAKASALTGKSLALRTLRHPCSSLIAWLGIHLHALLLFLKKTPYYEKHENLSLQKPHYIRSKSG